jgi:hypothetical protein
MMRDRKLMSLNSKELFHPEGVLRGKKRGTPENEGISLDVYENKRQIINQFGPENMFMNSKDL